MQSSNNHSTVSLQQQQAAAPAPSPSPLLTISKADLQREYFQQKYIETIRLYDDEKDYTACFLNCPELVRRLPASKRVWHLWAQSSEKMGLVSAARRCFIMAQHLRPNDVELLDQYRQFILTYGPHNGQAEEVRLRQLKFDPNDFELRMHYFKLLLAKKRTIPEAFRFITQYFNSKYVLAAAATAVDASTTGAPPLLNAQQISEFKTVADEFCKIEQWFFATQVLQLAVKLAPLEAPFYYQLYEIFSTRPFAVPSNYATDGDENGEENDDNEQEGDNAKDAASASASSKQQSNKRRFHYLEAFKALIHYMHISSSTSHEQYQVCAELLEKCNRPWHALLAYFQVWKETADRNILLYLETKILPQFSVPLSAKLPPIEELSLVGAPVEDATLTTAIVANSKT